MPGIITHSRLFHESLASLKRVKEATPFGRSLEALFSVPERLRAGYFGSIGPDIFDYLPVTRRDFFGTSLTMQLHSTRLTESLASLLSKTLLVGDFNNEWSATRRAYAYGYVSHLITDAVFHPFVYYWAGFPDNGSRAEIYRYREQLLLFQYNMDLFFQYHYNNQVFDFALEESLPVRPARAGAGALDYRSMPASRNAVRGMPGGASPVDMERAQSHGRERTGTRPHRPDTVCHPPHPTGSSEAAAGQSEMMDRRGFAADFSPTT